MMDTAPKPRSSLDTERFRLRRFIDQLAGSEELELRDSPTDLADVAKALDGNPNAALSGRAGRGGVERVGNGAGGRNRLARAFGVAPDKLLQEVLRRLRNKPEIVEIGRDQAPAQQVV